MVSPASPGAATGQIVFFADDAAKWAADGKKVVMVRIETSPEDLAGMAVAEGILTARGGMTSHAAVVARGMGKCCVSGAGAINVDYKTRTVEIEGITLKEGDLSCRDSGSPKGVLRPQIAQPVKIMERYDIREVTKLTAEQITAACKVNQTDSRSVCLCCWIWDRTWPVSPKLPSVERKGRK